MGDPAFDIVNPFATLGAAFVGAWYAFHLERTHRAEEEVKKRVGAANRALYTIFNLWNVQSQFQKEVINPYRAREDAWFNMAATVPAAYGLTTFEAGELSFLLSQKSTVYTDLMLEEQRFALAVQLVQTRSQLILEQAWPRLAKAEVALGTQLTETALERILGNDLVRKLKVISSGLILNIDENLASLRVAHDALREAMADLHPLQSFIRIDFTQPQQNVPAV